MHTVIARLRPKATALSSCMPPKPFLIFAWLIACACTGHGQERSNAEEALLAALNTFLASDQIITVKAETKTILDGAVNHTANVVATVPLNGSESAAVLAYEPYTSWNAGVPASQRTVRSVFNGRCWTHATYLIGNPGKDNFVPLKVVRITSKVHPAFSGYRHRSGLDLCLPFFRIPTSGGGFLYLQDFLVKKVRPYTVTEVQRGNDLLITLTLGFDEHWVLLDPEKDFLVVEHVNLQRDWSEKTSAGQFAKTRSGLWFATDCTFTEISRGKEVKRTEAHITEVSHQSKESFQQALQPQFTKGWRVIDERSKEEFILRDPSDLIQRIGTPPGK